MGKASKKVSKKQQVNKGILQSKKIEEAKKEIEIFKAIKEIEDYMKIIEPTTY